MSDCTICAEPLPLDDKFLKCSVCKDDYHLGKNCSTVTESAFSKMSSAKRESWVCPECKKQAVKQSVAGAKSDDAALAQQLLTVNDKLDRLTSTVETLTGRVEELLTFKATGERTAQTVLEIQGSLDSLDAKYESVSSIVTANQTAVSELGTQVDTLSATIVAQALLLEKVGSELNDLEQYSRRCNFEIHGLPYKPNEDLSSFLSELAAKLNISEFKATDVSALHRLPARSNTIPVILVQMHTVSAKQEWLSARGVLRELAHDSTFPRLYFNDNLSRAQRELYRLARLKGNDKHFKFVWTKNGRILAKKDEEAPVLYINKASDLESIV